MNWNSGDIGKMVMGLGLGGIVMGNMMGYVMEEGGGNFKWMRDGEEDGRGRVLRKERMWMSVWG